MERIQKSTNLTMAEIIRRAIDRFLDEWKETKEMPAGDAVTTKLISVAGICRGGPKNLSDRHDKYLYGESKK